jgi:hypothetical protein
MHEDMDWAEELDRPRVGMITSIDESTELVTPDLKLAMQL